MAILTNRERQKGQALVEFALILPLLVFLVGAAVDWGVVLLASHLVQNWSREGARAASVLADIDVADPDAVACSTSSTDPACEAVFARMPDVALMQDFTVTYTPPATGDCPNAEVSVTISGNRNFSFLRLANFFVEDFPSSIQIARNSTTRWERQPVSAGGC